MSALGLLVAWLLWCPGSTSGEDDLQSVQQNGRNAPAVVDDIVPKPLPDPQIPGFVFPEKEDTILEWARQRNQEAISKHAWGIWTALTSRSGEQYEGQELLVFETWKTPEDLLSLAAQPVPKAVPRDPRPLLPLRQLRSTAAAPGESTVLGFVKYDPVAAKHIVANKLFSAAQLKAFLQKGDRDVPAFDNSAISLKVVFRTLAQNKLVAGRYFMLPAWPGPPTPAQPFPPSAWKQCVWVDIQANGVGPGTGKVDTVCDPSGASRSRETTYGVDRFIRFRLSSAQAQAVNEIEAARAPYAAARAAAGDYAVLVGMHVTTREITRWTWQTFWWSPNPDNPPPPSSKAIAAARPAQLKGAPRHYSVATAYSMVYPPQPNTGGSHKGESVYAYNPWLEAGFGPAVLPQSKPGVSQGKPVANNVGVQTNCMSCHAQACYSPNEDLDPRYTRAISISTWLVPNFRTFFEPTSFGPFPTKRTNLKRRCLGCPRPGSKCSTGRSPSHGTLTAP